MPLLFSLIAFSATAHASDAEIVSIIGKGDTREPDQHEWEAATVKDKLPPGTFVRTRDFSQMALLLQDQTQLRLNQDSMVQIKEVSSTGATTRLELNQGRVWTQAKRKIYSSSPALPPAVIVQTPNATAAIRGTDWELVVDRNGVATLTVLSGVVEFYNDYGRISVHPNEQARAELGKAPSKMLLTNAKDRVQWVTAYRPQPRRWLQPVPAALLPSVQAIEDARYGVALSELEKRNKELHDTESTLLLADLYLFLGRVHEAISLLQEKSDDASAAALLARAYLIDDRADESGQVLAEAGKKFPHSEEILIAKGDLASFNGNANAAKNNYRQVIEGNPKNSQAWFGLGRVDTEREDMKAGRKALDQAIALNPEGAGYQGERATLESFADNFSAAGKDFAAALKQQPDDYVSLTGLGILQLKSGDANAALESFLKAGVIEPHYARGSLYTGVAYYQLGNYPRAIEMFKRAAELDPKDPMPYIMMSLAAADRVDLGDAVQYARQASKLMPYLKSLNQLLNDQKGNANLGASLGMFGLEEWAQAYAHNSYTPYWAGSHLFLADRYNGDFNKNSELFMGFLSDPSVFGASNRFNTLIASPGNYFNAGGRYIRSQVKQKGLTLTANGYNVSDLPFSYFLSADPVRVQPGGSDIRNVANNYTLGLGLRPTHDLGFFVFGNNFDFASGVRQGGATPYDISLKDRSSRLDLGANYIISPTSQLWLKGGSGSEVSSFGGSQNPAGWANSMNLLADAVFGFPFCSAFVPGGCYSSTVTFTRYNTYTSQSDLQLRHTFDANDSLQLSWGIETGKQGKPFDIQMNTASIVGFPATITTFQGHDDVKSQQAYFSGTLKYDESLSIVAALARSGLTETQSQLFGQTILGVPVQQTLVNNRNINEWNPQVGFSWHPATGSTLRLAVQSWRRPASVNTLAPVDTAGIPVDDRLAALGGKLERARIQYEWEGNSSIYTQIGLDKKRVGNLNNSITTPVTDFGLQDLRRLTSQNQLLPLSTDFWESTPLFGSADVDSTDFAANSVLANNLSGNMHYYYNQGRNTGSGFLGKQVPWMPRHLFRVGADWLPSARWQLSFASTFRSSRFTDEANTQLLSAGWSFGLRSSLLSADKKWSLEAVAENLHAKKSSAAAFNPSAIFGIQVLSHF